MSQQPISAKPSPQQLVLQNENALEPTHVESLGDRLVRVPLESLTLPPATHTNTYLVRGKGDWWVFDLGSADLGQWEKLDLAVITFCGGWHNVAGVLLSHHHPDHVAGLPVWRARIEKPVFAHHLTFERLGLMGSDLRFTGHNDTIDGLKIWHTPGHAPGHLVVQTLDNDLLGADLTSGIGTIVVDPEEGTMRDYLYSLELAGRLPLQRLFPSHGPHAEDARTRLAQYLEHRLARERRVVAALDARTPRTSLEVAAIAYDQPSAFVMPIAHRNVLAHLHKLVEDGVALSRGPDQYVRAAGA